jgi:hypothetical protein
MVIRKNGRSTCIYLIRLIAKKIIKLIEICGLNQKLIFYFVSFKLASDIDPNSLDECCICLERKPDVILPCTHSYCLPCIEQWNVDHKTCPGKFWRQSFKRNFVLTSLTDCYFNLEYTTELLYNLN